MGSAPVPATDKKGRLRLQTLKLWHFELWKSEFLLFVFGLEFYLSLQIELSSCLLQDFSFLLSKNAAGAALTDQKMAAPDGSATLFQSFWVKLESGPELAKSWARSATLVLCILLRSRSNLKAALSLSKSTKKTYNIFTVCFRVKIRKF